MPHCCCVATSLFARSAVMIMTASCHTALSYRRATWSERGQPTHLLSSALILAAEQCYRRGVALTRACVTPALPRATSAPKRLKQGSKGHTCRRRQRQKVYLRAGRGGWPSFFSELRCVLLLLAWRTAEASASAGRKTQPNNGQDAFACGGYHSSTIVHEHIPASSSRRESAD